MKMNKRKTKIILAAIFLMALGALYLFVPHFTVQVKAAVGILARADIKAMRIYLHSFGMWAPVISMGLMVLQALAAPLPAFVITFANAWVFGWVWGAVYSWTGAMIGASICFWIARVYGRPVVEKMVGKKSLQMSDEFFAQYGRYSVIIARLIPVVPFDIISYAGGLTTIGFGEFFWATGLGQLPATIIYSWLGENISPSAKYAFWAVCGFLVLLFFSLAVKKRIKGRIAGEADV